MYLYVKALCASLLLLASYANNMAQNTPYAKVTLDSIQEEIHAIENGLIKEIQIAGDSLETFNILNRMQQYVVPGISVAVVTNGKIRWAKSYGVASTATAQPLDEATLFQAASISKPLSALAILKLVEEGQVDLDTDVNTYLKNWKLTTRVDSLNSQVTLRQLLTHTAGTNVGGFEGYYHNEAIPTTTAILNGEGKSEKLEIVYPPGQQWKYSGGGYVLLQKVVEDISGQPFETFMRENILLPIGMKNSTYDQPIDTNTYHNISAGHTPTGDVMPGKWNTFAEKGAGGLWTTPSDLARYCIAIQNIMAGKTGFLKKSTLQLMLSKHQRNWGLGPVLQGSGDQLLFTHDGSNPGYRADFFGFVYQGNAAIVMTNSDNGGEIAEEFLRAVSKQYDWNARPQQVIDPPALSETYLQTLAGQYSWKERPLYQVSFEVRGQQLWMLVPEDTQMVEIPLTPKDQLHFIHIDTGMTIDFSRDANQHITGMTWRGRFEFEKK